MPRLQLVSPSRTDFQVTNEIGTVLQTFGAADLARAWAKSHCEVFGLLDVEEVTVTETRKRIYRAKPRSIRSTQRLEDQARASATMVEAAA